VAVVRRHEQAQPEAVAVGWTGPRGTGDAMTAGPNFLVIGAAKSGTTSLCHYLRQHPDVFVAREKESHFFLFEEQAPAFTGPGDAEEFTPLIITDRDRYLQCFSTAGGASARGEASVYYLYEPRAIERALAYDPKMRFVALLRDPVDRAFSAWSHMTRDGREPEQDFLTAVDAEPVRTARGWSYGFRYESVGRYAAQLQAVRDLVPPEQVHVLLYEDLVEQPGPALSRLFDFLGVSDLPVDSSLVMNASGRPRLRALNQLLTQRNPVKEGLKKVLPYHLGTSVAHRLRNWNLQAITMSEAEQSELRKRYANDIAELADLLGRDLGEWRDRQRT
jgi:hypothetical protein